MIQVTPHMRILVAVDPVDFRKGIDGLAAVCRQRLRSDPFSGALFVFVNKSHQALRFLVYDGQGYWLCHKRLSQGRFKWGFRSTASRTQAVAAYELQLLLWNADVKMPAVEEFRPVEKNFRFHKESTDHGRTLLL